MAIKERLEFGPHRDGALGKPHCVGRDGVRRTTLCRCRCLWWWRLKIGRESPSWVTRRRRRSVPGRSFHGAATCRMQMGRSRERWGRMRARHARFFGLRTGGRKPPLFTATIPSGVAKVSSQGSRQDDDASRGLAQLDKLRPSLPLIWSSTLRGRVRSVGWGFPS
jgi:hypothetical protein